MNHLEVSIFHATLKMTNLPKLFLIIDDKQKQRKKFLITNTRSLRKATIQEQENLKRDAKIGMLSKMAKFVKFCGHKYFNNWC
jgi:hypothetical protein